MQQEEDDLNTLPRGCDVDLTRVRTCIHSPAALAKKAHEISDRNSKELKATKLAHRYRFFGNEPLELSVDEPSALEQVDDEQGL